MAAKKSKINPVVIGVAGTALIGGTAIAAKLLSKKRNRDKLKKVAKDLMENGEKVKEVVDDIKSKSKKTLTAKGKRKK